VPQVEIVELLHTKCVTILQNIYRSVSLFEICFFPVFFSVSLSLARNCRYDYVVTRALLRRNRGMMIVSCHMHLSRIWFERLIFSNQRVNFERNLLPGRERDAIWHAIKQVHTKERKEKCKDIASVSCVSTSNRRNTRRFIFFYIHIS